MNATTIKLAALAILMTGWGVAATDPFIGKWKRNIAKSKTAGHWVKVEDLGSNKYRFDDGAVPETFVADGKDRPVEYGGTMSLQKTGDTTWKTVFKRDDRILYHSTWSMSPDGKTLTIHTTGTRLDGSTYENEEVYSKTTGTSGLAGTWESKSEKQSSPSIWEIQPYENGLSFVYPASKSRLDMTFDGKEYTEEGPTAPKGISTSGKRPNSNTLQLTNKHEGKVIDTADWSVSSDGKVLTVTVHNTGQKKSEVLVYDRQ
jgi:hypothetical protein